MPYDLPNKLRKARGKRHWSTDTLAKQATLPERLIADFEANRKEPTAYMAFLLCQALGCSGNYLLGTGEDAG